MYTYCNFWQIFCGETGDENNQGCYFCYFKVLCSVVNKCFSCYVSLFMWLFVCFQGHKHLPTKCARLESKTALWQLIYKSLLQCCFADWFLLIPSQVLLMIVLYIFYTFESNFHIVVYLFVFLFVFVEILAPGKNTQRDLEWKCFNR